MSRHQYLLHLDAQHPGKADNASLSFSNEKSGSWMDRSADSGRLSIHPNYPDPSTCHTILETKIGLGQNWPGTKADRVILYDSYFKKKIRIFYRLSGTTHLYLLYITVCMITLRGEATAVAPSGSCGKGFASRVTWYLGFFQIFLIISIYTLHKVKQTTQLS